MSGLARLRALSTCDVSDALLKLGEPHGGLIPDMTMFSPTMSDAKVVGPAFTVKLVTTNDPDERKPGAHFVDACPAGSVIVMQQAAGVKTGSWGGLMTTAALVKGIEGVVIDGGCRDLNEHRTRAFAVFARHHSTLGPSTFTRVVAHNEPLTIYPLEPQSTPPFPPVTISPGDIVLADVDGVVMVPIALLEQVVELAEVGRDADEMIRQDLEAGRGVAESMKKWRSKA